MQIEQSEAGLYRRTNWNRLIRKREKISTSGWSGRLLNSCG